MIACTQLERLLKGQKGVPRLVGFHSALQAKWPRCVVSAAKSIAVTSHCTRGIFP